jgi:hypothetical protein
VALTLALIVAVGALCEGLASAALSVLETRLRFPEPQLYLAEPSIIKRLARHFDAELGWTTPYGTRFGERPRGVDRGRPLVAAFGDSFTHGDEVEDGETWAEALAQSLGGDVFNFGVGGYGMDQTLLRFERDGPRRPTPIAIFAFISGDLERCYWRYWKFHSPESPFTMTKPRLVLKSDSLELLPNPVRTPQALQAGVQDVAFVERLSREDPSFNPYGLPPIHRPYLWLLAQPSVWRGALAAIRPRNIWSEPGAVRLAEQILLRFAQVARERGARPVIVQLPLHSEMVQQLERGNEPLVTAETRAICERNVPNASCHCSTSRPVRWAALGIFRARGRRLPERGNRWIADARRPPATARPSSSPVRAAGRRARLAADRARPPGASEDPIRFRRLPAAARERARARPRGAARRGARTEPGARRDAPAAPPDLDRRCAGRARDRWCGGLAPVERTARGDARDRRVA